MQSDLGLEEWLRSNVTAADTGTIHYSDGPSKTNVLSHDIKFSITNTGNITPGWKLTRVIVNQGGNFLSATRDRINNVTFTLGPADPVSKTEKDKQGKVRTVTSYVPSGPAHDAAQASQIGVSVSNGIKSALQP